jgi:hypothetical protein
LLSTFGSEDIPACGFGFGDAVIVEVWHVLSYLWFFIDRIKQSGWCKNKFSFRLMFNADKGNICYYVPKT